MLLNRFIAVIMHYQEENISKLLRVCLKKKRIRLIRNFWMQKNRNVLYLSYLISWNPLFFSCPQHKNCISSQKNSREPFKLSYNCQILHPQYYCCVSWNESCGFCSSSLWFHNKVDHSTYQSLKKHSNLIVCQVDDVIKQ